MTVKSRKEKDIVVSKATIVIKGHRFNSLWRQFWKVLREIIFEHC